MKCYNCETDIVDDIQYSEYELKKDNSKIQFCFECENHGLVYFDIIKRKCFIDGEDKELTKQDRKYITREKKLKNEKLEEDRLLDVEKSIFLFCNREYKSLEKLDVNNSLLKYVNHFIDSEEEHGEEHIQRFRFPFSKNKVWKLNYEGLGDITITLEGFNKEVQIVRKNKNENWRDRTRKWYFGNIYVGEDDMYNCTFGFAIYGDKNGIQYNDIYVNFNYTCSYEWKFRRVLAYLLKDKFNIIDYDEKVNIRFICDINKLKDDISKVVKDNHKAKVWIARREKDIEKIERQMSFNHIRLISN